MIEEIRENIQEIKHILKDYNYEDKYFNLLRDYKNIKNKLDTWQTQLIKVNEDLKFINNYKEKDLPIRFYENKAQIELIQIILSEMD